MLMHSPLTTLLTRYLPDAAVDAVNVQSWLALVPSPQPYCCSWVPEVVDPLGTSMQRPLLPLARLNWPEPRSDGLPLLAGRGGAAGDLDQQRGVVGGGAGDVDALAAGTGGEGIDAVGDRGHRGRGGQHRDGEEPDRYGRGHRDSRD